MVVVEKEEQCDSALVGSCDNGGQCNVNSGQELANDGGGGDSSSFLKLTLKCEVFK